MQLNHKEILETTKERILSFVGGVQDQKWNVESNKDGYLIQTKDNLENGLKIIRTETYSDVDPEQFVKFVSDMSRKKEYDSYVVECKIIEKLDENTFISYFRGKSPAMFIDGRDFHIITKIIQQQDGSWMSITKSIETPQVPPVKGGVRGEIIFNSYILKKLPNGQTKILAIANADPKGDLPKAIVNLGSKMQAEGLKKALEHFKKQKK